MNILMCLFTANHLQMGDNLRESLNKLGQNIPVLVILQLCFGSHCPLVQIQRVFQSDDLCTSLKRPYFDGVASSRMTNPHHKGLLTV